MKHLLSIEDLDRERIVGLLDGSEYMSEVLAREKAILEEKNAGKKPEMMEKIIQGKVSKRMSDICLLNQVENNFVKCDRPSYRSPCEFFH